MKRYLIVVALAATVALSLSPVAGATEYDGKYTGTIQCDTIPGITTIPLRAGFVLKIADGRAQYEREVLNADSSIPQGVTERGMGPVSSTGEVSLTGSAVGPTWKYDASYRGPITGKNLRLTGVQQWTLRTGPHTRPCTITLSRAD